MKILFFLSNISLRGGTERACIAVCNELASKGEEVHLFSVAGDTQKPAFPLHPSIQVHGLGIDKNGLVLRFYLPKIFIALKQYLKKNEIDTLINVEVMACLFTFPFLFSSKKQLQYIVWEHFNYTVDLGLKQRRFFRRLVAKRADAVVTLTHKDQEMWRENLQPQAKVVTIYNPSPFNISTLEYQGNSKSILAVGRFTEQKGYDLLIESWNILQEHHYEACGGWTLSIIGDGEEKPKIEDLIKQLNLDKTVDIVSNTNNIASYYENASFLCMSSRFEGLPMVLIEAQSYGLPIVSFDCLTGPSDVIVDGSGYLCEPLNTKKLADAMLRLILSVQTRVEMSKFAKIQAERFAPQKVVKDWQNLLSSL